MSTPTTRADAVLDALIATLKKANGTGTYRNDLTHSGSQPARVYRGFYEAPPVPPSAPVFDGAGDLTTPGRPTVCAYFSGERVTPGESMHRFTVEMVFLVKAWAGGSPRHAGIRLQNAADLFRDLSETIKTNQSLAHTSSLLPGYAGRGLVDGLTWDGIPFDGDGNNSQKARGQQFGEVMLSVTATWREARPAQSAAA